MSIRAMCDIPPDFRWNKTDSQMVKKVLPHEGTGESVKVFARYAWRMSDYLYWFLLGTLWVSYTGWSDLELWKRLFSATRAGRETGLMKPSELAVLGSLPEKFFVYRAHRPNETAWISYTLDPEKAAEFAARRGVSRIAQYAVEKRDILALFLRRGEAEVLVLDQSKAEFVQNITVVINSEMEAVS